LLDGRRVTTHWNYRERLARRYPRAQVTADDIYLSDGPLLTSAGVTAGIDLA
ncbi:MAG TPA: AraC family transcriptional regulator, partial [Pseudomonas sp.]|nr:AraC family transcriptional regulator [Pseudomonas sp.]